jgi:hypothetical protein
VAEPGTQARTVCKSTVSQLSNSFDQNVLNDIGSISRGNTGVSNCSFYPVLVRTHEHFRGMRVTSDDAADHEALVHLHLLRKGHTLSDLSTAEIEN